ncbi:MAG: YeeE/YedE family protein [Rhodospirillaceae bacterium]
MAELPVGLIVSSAGFGLGIVFGITAQRTNFCTMGALSDAVFMEEWNRFRAWMLAVAVAVLGSQALHIAGVLNLSKSIYLTANLGWAGAIIGGLLFGFGMTMTGGCGNKTLVRLGAGNLKSLVVAVVLGIFAYMTLRGLIGLARVELEGATNIDLGAHGMKTQGIPDLIAQLAVPAGTAQIAVTAVVVLGLLWFCFKSEEFRQSKADVAAGLIIGALVPAAWYVTGVIGNDEFEPVAMASFTFVAPVGESIQYLMTFTGSKINFGIAVVGGVIMGSFLSAKVKGEFKLESFTDANDMARHLFGASIMGIGGVMALGCTVGQGITGMSTLAFGSVLALGSIMLGGVIGLKYIEEGSLGAAIGAVFSRS